MLTKTKGCILLSKLGSLIKIEVDDESLVDFISKSPHINSN